MPYAWDDLFAKGTPQVLQIQRAIDKGEDLASLRDPFGRMSVLDGMIFGHEHDCFWFPDPDFRHRFESYLRLTKQVAGMGTPVVRKLTLEDFLIILRGLDDGVAYSETIFNHEVVLVAIAAGRGPVLRHLVDRHGHSLLDMALELADEDGDDYLRMVRELVSASVPLKRFAPEWGGLAALFRWEWISDRRRQNRRLQCRLEAAIAAGLAQKICCLATSDVGWEEGVWIWERGAWISEDVDEDAEHQEEEAEDEEEHHGLGNESFVNCNLVKMVFTDPELIRSCDEVRRFIGTLRKLGATTRLAIAGIQETLSEHLQQPGIDVRHILEVWQNLVTWHRCQEAYSNLTGRTLLACFPSNVVATIDVFLLGVRVPMYDECLHIGADGQHNDF